MKRARIVPIVVVLTIVAMPAFTQTTDPDDDVPLYTNEDLEQYGDMTATDPPASYQDVDSPDWETVEKFLTRQYSRIDADRNWDLARERAETERIIAVGVRPRYTLPWAYPFWAHRRTLPYRTPASLDVIRPGIHRRPAALPRLPHRTPATRAIPGGGLRHGSATGLKGSDAVPTRPNAATRGRGRSDS